MCGIVGFYGKWSIERERAFKDMLRLDVLRGPHSTGVALCGNVKGHNPKIVKGTLLPEQLLSDKKFKQATEKVYWDCYMGHNRFATMGRITPENAHPFVQGNIVGMHNGTLRNKYDLSEYLKYDVDSELIFSLINKEGIKNTYKKLRGSLALVWWDKREPSLNFIRNNDRPLFYAYTTNNDALFWASEAWIIQIACLRNEVKHGKIYGLGTDKHFVIKFEEVETKKGEKKDGKIKIKNKKLKPWKAPKTKKHTFVNQNTKRYQGDNYLGTGYGGLYGEFGVQEDARDHQPWKGWDHRREDDAAQYPINYHDTNRDNKKTVTRNKSVIPSTVKEIVSGQSYNIYKNKDIRVIKGQKNVKYIIYFNFQNFPKRKAKAIFLKEHIAVAERILNSPFTKLFFKAVVTGPSRSRFGGKEEDVYLVNIETIEPIVPLEAERICLPKEVLNRKDFNEKYEKCYLCEDPLIFEDDDIEFVLYGKDEAHALCSSCSKTLGEGQRQRFVLNHVFFGNSGSEAVKERQEKRDKK